MKLCVCGEERPNGDKPPGAEFEDQHCQHCHQDGTQCTRVDRCRRSVEHPHQQRKEEEEQQSDQDPQIFFLQELSCRKDGF